MTDDSRRRAGARVAPAATVAGVSAPTTAQTPVAGQREGVAERDQDRRWYELARELRTITPDLAGAPGIDYARLANRVQSSTADPEAAMLAAALRGAGHVRPDPVEARLSRIEGRPLKVLRWLRGYGPALEWLAADMVEAHRGTLLDALAQMSGIATKEEAQRWEVSQRAADARRSWARLRLREAWSAWYGRAW